MSPIGPTRLDHQHLGPLALAGERNHEAGVGVSGAQATLEGVLVRDILPSNAEGFGMGIAGAAGSSDLASRGFRRTGG